MDIHKLKNDDLIFTITCVMAVISAIVGITGFILYIGARIKADEVKEKLYMKLHYIALTILLLLVIIALNVYEEPN